MNETVPLGRYIARHHGYYPTDPMEAFKNDWLVEKYQPVINGMDAHLFKFGKEKKDMIHKVCTELLPNFFKLIEEYTKEGWLIGDGSKIYMCDFFIGSIYTDLFVNQSSWMSD